MPIHQHRSKFFRDVEHINDGFDRREVDRDRPQVGDQQRQEDKQRDAHAIFLTDQVGQARAA